MRIFRDRKEAGQLLAKELTQYANHKDAIVLALPRGGVPVGFEISKKLNIPLDAFLVRKLGVPWQEELAMGAVAMGNVRILNQEIIASAQIPAAEIEEITQQQQAELARRNELYRQNKPIPNLIHKTVILVDDGIATGATMHAAVEAIRQAKPAKIIIAVPVAPPETYRTFKQLVDEIICLEIPEMFSSVGQWYEFFPQTSDEEVIELLGTY